MDPTRIDALDWSTLAKGDKVIAVWSRLPSRRTIVEVTHVTPAYLWLQVPWRKDKALRLAKATGRAEADYRDIRWLPWSAAAELRLVAYHLLHGLADVLAKLEWPTLDRLNEQDVRALRDAYWHIVGTLDQARPQAQATD